MKDLAGQSFGDLLAVQSTPKRQNGNVIWVCVCICGKQVEVNSNRLVCGITKSCGCRKGRVTTAQNVARTKHGHAKTYQQSPTYKSWQNMIARCEDPRHPQFRYYGKRGITVDPRWRESFLAFLEDMGERPPEKTLDRKRPYEGYGPDNCRWATDEEQASNRRNTHLLTLNGETLHLSKWARRLGGRPNALRARLKDGWPLERALTEPFQVYKARTKINPIPAPLRKARTLFRQRFRHLDRPGDDLTFEQWQVVLEAHGHKCAYCGSGGPLTVDHVTPLSRGGLHTVSNVVPACKPCNSSKKASLV